MSLSMPSLHSSSVSSTVSHTVTSGFIRQSKSSQSVYSSSSSFQPLLHASSLSSGPLHTSTPSACAHEKSSQSRKPFALLSSMSEHSSLVSSGSPLPVAALLPPHAAVSSQ